MKMDFQDLSNLIKTRRSIRKFEDKPVPEDLLLKALELATWAPNGGNFQPWRFVIIQNKGMIEKMADAVKAKTEQMGSWPEANQFGETIKRWQRNADFFRNAPICIAVLMGKYVSVADQILKSRRENDPVAREVRSNRQIGNSSLQSVAAAITYLLLILHQFGLGSTWVAGVLIAKKEIEQMLDVPYDWDFVDLIPIGYPAETPSVPMRNPIADVVSFLK
jgi:nitroreductase